MCSGVLCAWSPRDIFFTVKRTVASLAFLSVLASGAAHATPPGSSSAPPSSPSPDLTVTSPARTALLSVGDTVPAFHAVAHDGRVIDVAPGARRDVLVVFFYPRDATPG